MAASNRPDIIFIGTATETFTPHASGAIATIMHQLSRRAQAEGLTPRVVARRANVPPFTDVDVSFYDLPPAPTSGLPLLARRAQRKLAGWSRLRQGEWMRAMTDLLTCAEFADRPWVMFNEPELAMHLRRRLPRTRIVHWFQNQLQCKPRARRALRDSVDVVLGVSDFTSRWVEDYYGLPRGDVQTVYNAVDTEHFYPANAPPPGPIVINFVGRTGIEKAPDLLLKAALRLADRCDGFAIQLVGSNHFDGYTEDEYQRELQRLASKLRGRGVEVRTTGHVGRADLPQVIRRAHIHVVPSRWDEPFGLVTLEGMASGLAVVASDTGGTPEVVGDVGILFRRDDADDLADKLEPLLRDPSRRAALGHAARARAMQFTWEHCWRSLRPHLFQDSLNGFDAARVSVLAAG